MLTYATLAQFKRMKQVSDIESVEGDRKVKEYLARATNYINRVTRREFFPWYEVRRFPIPHRFLDLKMRRFGAADLYMDQDLLEVTELVNGDGSILTSDYWFLMQTNITPYFAIAIKWPMYWGGMYNLNVLSSNFDQPVISVEGVWGYHHGYTRPNVAWIDTYYDVTGTGGINASTKTITVTDTGLLGMDAINEVPIDVGQLIKIDSEFMEVTAVQREVGQVDPSFDNGFSPGFESSINVLTVIRGVRGTDAAAHDEGARVYKWQVEQEITEVCLQIARTWRESDTAAGGRLGVSEYSAGVEISIPQDPARILATYVRSITGAQ